MGKPKKKKSSKTPKAPYPTDPNVIARQKREKRAREQAQTEQAPLLQLADDDTLWVNGSRYVPEQTPHPNEGNYSTVTVYHNPQDPHAQKYIRLLNRELSELDNSDETWEEKCADSRNEFSRLIEFYRLLYPGLSFSLTSSNSGAPVVISSYWGSSLLQCFMDINAPQDNETAQQAKQQVTDCLHLMLVTTLEICRMQKFGLRHPDFNCANAVVDLQGRVYLIDNPLEHDKQVLGLSYEQLFMSHPIMLSELRHTVLDILAEGDKSHAAMRQEYWKQYQLPEQFSSSYQALYCLFKARLIHDTALSCQGLLETLQALNHGDTDSVYFKVALIIGYFDATLSSEEDPLKEHRDILAKHILYTPEALRDLSFTAIEHSLSTLLNSLQPSPPQSVAPTFFGTPLITSLSATACPKQQAQVTLNNIDTLFSAVMANTTKTKPKPEPTSPRSSQ